MEENKRKIYKKMKCCKKDGKCKISWTMTSADVIFKELLRSSSQSHARRAASRPAWLWINQIQLCVD